MIVKQEQYSEALLALRGKTIAIVYIFANEDAKGYDHYDIWGSDLIADWVRAVGELGCTPLILDARTFVYKAMNTSLPVIDFVVNLNNGNTDISTLGLIPSTSAFLGILCIPGNAVATLMGENKLVSNLVAFAKQFNVPKELDFSSPCGISRPVAYGSSINVKRCPLGFGKSNPNEYGSKLLYQEFINGVDMTTPLIFNPLLNKLDVLPAIMYHPKNGNFEWFLGETEKASRNGYEKRAVRVNEEVKKYYQDFARTMSIDTYCRIDARVQCTDEADIIAFANHPVEFEHIYFLEINPMPTIKEGINFHTSIQSLKADDSFFKCKELYWNNVHNPTFTGLVLSCAMLAHIIPKYGIL
jgi:hypothetical protein